MLTATPSLRRAFVTLISGFVVACGRFEELEDDANDTWSYPSGFSQNTCKQMKAEYLTKETNPVIREALGWVCTYFKYKQEKRCADFISTVIRDSHVPMQGFQFTVGVPTFAKMGTEVSLNNLQPGDLVIYKNTYKLGPHTHIGLFIGNNLMIHRPTFDGTVEFAPIRKEKFSTARRLTAADWNLLPLKIFSFKPGLDRSYLKSNTEQSSNLNIKCILNEGAVLTVRVMSEVDNHAYVKVESIRNASAGCAKGTVGYIYKNHFYN